MRAAAKRDWTEIADAILTDARAVASARFAGDDDMSDDKLHELAKALADDTPMNDRARLQEILAAFREVRRLAMEEAAGVAVGIRATSARTDLSDPIIGNLQEVIADAIRRAKETT